MDCIDFNYEISDEHLLIHSRLPILDHLRWLDEVRLFSSMVRQAPMMQRKSNESVTAATEIP